MIIDYAPALLAPLLIWLLWQLQAGSVRGLRGAMVRLTRGNRWLYHTVSWFGTLLHETSHAIVLLLSGHGIRGFSVKSTTGHVLPRRLRRDPFSTLAFAFAALAPQFFVPGLTLLGAILLLGTPFETASGTGWDGFLGALEGLLQIPVALGTAMATVDLASWQGALFFGFVLLGAPGTRPSHVKENGQNDGDIAVLRGRIRSQPLPFVGFWILLLAAHPLLMWLAPQGYWAPMQWIWATAITGVLIAITGSIAWSTTYQNSRIQPAYAWLPLTFLLAGQVGLRFTETPVWAINAISFGAWILLAWSLARVAQKRDVYSRF